MKAELERREYLCGLDLLGIKYKKVKDFCEYGDELWVSHSDGKYFSV